MIASHYAEPVERRVVEAVTLRSAPSVDSDAAAELDSGDSFWILDETLGWAWGYAGREHRVGYVPSDALKR